MISGPPLNEAHMNESISEIKRLLQKIAGHLKSGTKTDARKAVAKVERIAALGSTWVLTIQARQVPEPEEICRGRYAPPLL
jgi:hypothetical protein